MKKLSFVWVVVLFVVLGIGGGLFYVRSIPASPVLNNQDAAIPLSLPLPTDTPTLLKEVYQPKSLSIPKLGIEAQVEEVGEDSFGRMDVPKGDGNVGWYSLGYKPGEQGSAVMAGHFDTVTGTPAVFYYVNQLIPGDKVIVADKNGRNLTFQVVRVEIYRFDHVPLQEIFASHDKPRLNLITCAGVWNQGSRNYSERTVVYTELKS